MPSPQTITATGTFTAVADGWHKFECWAKGGTGGNGFPSSGGGGAGSSKVTFLVDTTAGDAFVCTLGGFGANTTIVRDGTTLATIHYGASGPFGVSGIGSTDGCSVHASVEAGSAIEIGGSGYAASGDRGGDGGAGGGTGGGAGGAGGNNDDGNIGAAPGGGGGAGGTDGIGYPGGNARVIVTWPVDAPAAQSRLLRLRREMAMGAAS